MPQSPCILLTGATGFAGGAILAHLSTTHPQYRIKALIRKQTVVRDLEALYPNLDLIIGDLSSPSLISSIASEVDFIIHASGDDASAVCAMIEGLASKPAASKPRHPRLITLTGPRSLIDLSRPITGNLDSNSQPWSDVDDAQSILTLPKDRIHANADQTIIAHAIKKGVDVLLISPGQLWGRGKGPVKKESNSAFYYNAVKSRGRAFVIGKGTATWSWTSIGDLADAVVFLTEMALENDSRLGRENAGYFFVRTGDLSMIERASAISERLKSGDPESISIEDAKAIHPYGPIMWGCGERIRADKLADLGWRPKELDWRALMEAEGGERA